MHGTESLTADEPAAYNDVVFGSAERIIRMAELEQQHRHRKEMLILKAHVADQVPFREKRRRGQWMAFWIGCVAIVGGTVSACFGSQWAAAFIGGGGVAGLMTTFLIDHDTQNKQAAKDNSPRSWRVSQANRSRPTRSRCSGRPSGG